MLDIYRKSWRYFFASLPALVLFAAVIETCIWYLQPKSESSVTFIALAILAYFFHRHFLFGEAFSLTRQKPDAGAPPMKFGWFILLSGALILVPFGLALILALQIMPGGSPAPRIIGAMLLLAMPLYLIALSFFGTTLPALVVRDGSYRVSQGLRSGFQTLWRLLIGPALFGAVLIALLYKVGAVLDNAGMQGDSAATLAWFILIRTLGFFTTILAVAVLCEMYRRTLPAALGPIVKS
ncbi:hypothetical protein [Tabrizicola sp.]|uniref:hypothetical protein n=1 Tax=Tabrizicola sp. TaxID=2005166 RepID=UPI00286C7DE7|nr:hypothetical protein [Tabrizicola sp.]